MIIIIQEIYCSKIYTLNMNNVFIFNVIKYNLIDVLKMY